MSFDDKLAQIRALIEQYNTTSDDTGKKVDIDAFLKKLTEIGATNEDTLRAATFEDFEDAGLPRLIARRAAEIARATLAGEKPYVSQKSAQRMSIEELVRAYDPCEAIDGPVTTRLKTITRGQRSLVLEADGSVNLPLTLKLTREVIDGLAEREVVDDETGTPVRVYTFGERVGRILDENPAFPGEPLRPDGTCQRTDLDWSKISESDRQLVYLVVVRGIRSEQNACDLHDLAVRGMLRKRYKKMHADLLDARKLGKAPSLKVTLGPPTRGSSNDPFAPGRVQAR